MRQEPGNSFSRCFDHGDGLIVAARKEEMVRQRPTLYGTERIEYHELAHPDDALIHTPGEHQAVGITVNHVGVRGVESQSLL